MSADKAAAPAAAAPAAAAPAAAAPAAAKPKLSAEEVKKMVEAKREALKQQKAADDAKAAKEADTHKYFGVHTDITCDGCTVKPIVGFRYKCKHCANHDFCEECYAAWQKGTLKHKNARNPVSKRVEDHVWEPYVDTKQFKAAVDNAKKEMPKTNASAKVKPNDPCSCGSKKKYKKCCGEAKASAAAAPAAEK